MNADLGDRDEVIRNELRLLDGKIGKKRGQLDRLLDALENAEEDRSALRPPLNASQQELKLLEAKRLTTKADDASTRVQYVEIDRVLQYIESLKSTLENAPVKTRRIILRSFVKGIAVGKGRITFRFSIPEAARPTELADMILGTVTSGTTFSCILADRKLREPP